MDVTTAVSAEQYAALIARCSKPGAAILASLTPEKAEALHVAACLGSEVAELFSGLHLCQTDKCTREDYSANAGEELGDLEFYLVALERVATGTPATPFATPDCPTGELPADAHGVLRRMAVAAGDVFDAVKKWAIYGKDLDTVALEGHATELRLAMHDYGRVAGWTRAQWVAANYAKLNKRYPAGYADKAAQERADKA